MADDAEQPEGPIGAEDRVARARSRRNKAADEGDVAPKLPRGGGFRIGKGHLIKIALTASLLVMLIVVQRPCADAVSGFVTGFDGGSAKDKDKAKALMPKPGNVDGSGAATPHYETLKHTLTEAEWKAMVERQKSGGSASQGSEQGSAGSSQGSAGSAQGSQRSSAGSARSSASGSAQ